MKIYLSHARGAFDFKSEFYQPCVAAVGQKHELWMPHQTSELVNARDLFRDKKCDVVLAEASFPSTGQGIELAWAADLGLRIIAVHQASAPPSPALHLLGAEIRAYASRSDLANLLREIFDGARGR